MKRAANTFGIYDASYALLLEALASETCVDKAYIFGSRVLGNFRKGSDIDIALVGKDIGLDALTMLTDKLNEELPIPYYVDVLVYSEITNIKLKEHIDTHGELIYSS